MMFPQRGALILLIFLCCFRSCLCTNCAYFPYHPSCRGMMMKRTFYPTEYSEYPQSGRMHGNSHNGCSSSDCRAKIKYLFTLLNDNVDHQIASHQKNNPYDDYEVRKGLRFEERSRDNAFETRNMNRDYID